MPTRRDFALGLAATALAGPLLGAARPQIVIIGAGAAGLCVLRELERAGLGGTVDIRVIDPAAHYRPPFGSSRVLAGALSPDHHRQDLGPRLGDAQIRARVRSVDRVARRVILTDGSSVAYDALVVAPGLVPVAAVPNAGELAWFNDDSLPALLARLDTLPDGARIIVTAADLPYRCPPAPYERATLFVDYLDRRGRSDVRVTILDAKERFSLQAHFLNYWETRLGGRVEWLPPSVHDGITEITPTSVTTGFDEFRADFVHAVPQQRAPDFCLESDLADFTGFCPVDTDTFRSTLDGRIYCVGDVAKAGEMPKSASSAQAQARRAAADLIGRLGGSAPAPGELASHCFSVLAAQFAISSHSRFKVEGGLIRRVAEDLSHYPPETDTGAAEFAVAQQWYAQTLTAMGFGVQAAPAALPA